MFYKLIVLFFLGVKFIRPWDKGVFSEEVLDADDYIGNLSLITKDGSNRFSVDIFKPFYIGDVHYPFKGIEKLIPISRAPRAVYGENNTAPTLQLEFKP